MKCPCKGCENAGCGVHHDSCEPYLEWQAERRKENEKRFATHHEMSRDHELKYRKNLRRGGIKRR